MEQFERFKRFEIVSSLIIFKRLKAALKEPDNNGCDVQARGLREIFILCRIFDAYHCM
jgi:hypothetical protein